MFAGETTALRITNEVSEAIVSCLFERCVTSLLPNTAEALQTLQGYMNFPYAFAAIDGCHVPIACPSDEAARRDYYNYKNFYSIVLMAMVDGKGRFLWAQAGMPGNVHDSTILQAANIWPLLQSICELKTTLIGTVRVPALLLVDSAFPFRTYLMKRFTQASLSLAQRKFNKLHAQSRIVVENAFGILKMKYRELFRTSERAPENVKYSVLASIVLHNLTIDIPPPQTPGQEISLPVPLNHPHGSRDSNQEAIRVRDAILPFTQ